MGTLSAIKHNPVIKSFYDRLIGKGKHHNVAMVACIKKLLRILNAMAQNGTPWQENYGIKLESGDTIPIQKTKKNWVMSPVSCQRIHYTISTQTQFR